MLNIRTAILIMIAALLAVACSIIPNGAPEPVPTALPLPTATPTATPSPTPTPTPTPLPIVVVEQGVRALRNGDWDSAALAFQQVLVGSGASPDERFDAQIGLAHAYGLMGDNVSALAILNNILSEFPDHPDSARVIFLRGETRAKLGDTAGAVEDYAAYLALRPGVIDSIIYERMGDAYLAAGMAEPAAQSFEQALAAPRYASMAPALHEKAASAYRMAGSAEAAVAHYEAVLALDISSGYRATLEFYIGQTWYEIGDYDRAYERFQQVFLTYPASYEALSALRTLLEDGVAVNQYQRGIVNYNHGQYDIALMAFDNYIAETPVSEIDPAVYLHLGRTYRALEDYQNALAEMEYLVNEIGQPAGAAWADGWLEIAEIYAEMGDYETAYATYMAFASSYPDQARAPDALAAAGHLATGWNDQERAAAAFRQMSAAYPDDERSSEGLFEVALAAFRAGAYDQAEALFSEAAQNTANERPAAAHFWLGKTLTATGRAEEAANSFSTAMSLEPTGYYGLRAAQLLAGQSPFTAPPGFALPDDPDTGRLEAEQWLVDRFGLAETPPLAESLRGDIAADPRFVRAAELWELGLVSEARLDYEDLRRSYISDPLALYQLAIYFREIGLFRSSILCATRLHLLAEIAPLDGPAFLARLRYPTYFSDLVLSYSELYGLDPLFVFALIEQESLFEGFAVSSASAQGLMQIWPPTGEDIAAQIGWPDYQVTDLQRPLVSVAFGAWLLADEFERLDGDASAVLAAYNAGSGRALAWQAAAMGDPDMFAEVISLSEPRAYVQAITQHYAVYRSLYSTGS